MDLSRPLYALALAILLSAFLVSCGDRYSTVAVGDRFLVQTDKWTGQSWNIRSGGTPNKTRIIEPE